jgi:hypothetical protein
MSAFLKFPMVSITDSQGHYKHDFSLANARKFAIRASTILHYLQATSWPINVKEIQEADSDRACAPLLFEIHKFIAQSIYAALVTRLDYEQNIVREPDHTEQVRLYPNAQHGQLGYNSYVFQTVPGRLLQDNNVLTKGDPRPLIEAAQRCYALAEVINDPQFRIYEGHPSQLTSHLLANLQILLDKIPEFAEGYLAIGQMSTAEGGVQIDKVEKQRRHLIAVQKTYMAQIRELERRYGNDSSH